MTLGIGKYNVKRALIDPGSSAKVIYIECFKRLGYKESDLQSTNCPMVGFNEVPVWPAGVISLPVTVGSVTEITDFLVVSVASPYNVIMGRTWIYKMKAMPLTYHKVIKFPTVNGVEEIWGDQVEAKKCYSAAISTKMAQVQSIEVVDRPVLEDIGSDPVSKVVEELEQVSAEQGDEERLQTLII